MITVSEALERLFGLVSPLGHEVVPLAEAAGRVMVTDAVARRTQPPFPASAMDGYAVRAADAALGRAYITVNKNSVPNDPQSPFVTSGLRLGTPAITTRGFGVEETRQLTGWIADILDDLDNEETIDRVRSQVLELCARFPVYG